MGVSHGSMLGTLAFRVSFLNSASGHSQIEGVLNVYLGNNNNVMILIKTY